MNKKGIVLPVFLSWLVGSLIIGSATGNKYALSKITKECVSNGGTQENCENKTKQMSFRNRMLALQK